MRFIKATASILAVFTLVMTSMHCNQSNEKQQATAYFARKLTELSGDFNRYYSYRYSNIKLFDEFRALDASSQPVDRKKFLDLLSTGDFMPLKVDNNPTYQLFRLPEGAEPSVSRDIKYFAAAEIFSTGMEGKPLPSFTFKDVHGKTWTNADLKDKIVLIKCWFIACKPCVEEFPEANQLVTDNGQRDDILFLSLALDKAKELKSFLQKKELAYHTIPEAEPFLTNSLFVKAYPTHILLDKSGAIVRYRNRIREIIPAFEKLKL